MTLLWLRKLHHKLYTTVLCEIVVLSGISHAAPSAAVYPTMCRPQPMGGLQDLLAAGNTPKGADAERASGAFGSSHGGVTHGSTSSLADSARGGSTGEAVASLQVPAGSSKLGPADGDAPAATSAAAAEVITWCWAPTWPAQMRKITGRVCAYRKHEESTCWMGASQRIASTSRRRLAVFQGNPASQT